MASDERDRGALARAHDERVARVRELVHEREGVGALLATRRNFAWLTVGGLNHVVVGSDEGAVPLLVTRDAVVALAPVNEAARVRDEELTGLPIDVVETPWSDPAAAADEAARRAGGPILRDADLEPTLVDRRARLIAVEHARMRRLATDLARIVGDGVGGVEPGVSEDELVGSVAGRLLAEGIRAPVLLAAADERIDRYRHPLPVGRRVERRMMIVVVGERHGLHVAITRFAELAEPPADLRARQRATDGVLDAMIGSTRAGGTLGAVLDAGRRAYAAAGFADEWRLHHQGGTIGYGSRERIATPGDVTPLAAGMAVAWNPSITGTKAEATLVVTDGEPELLLR